MTNLITPKPEGPNYHPSIEPTEFEKGFAQGVAQERARWDKLKATLSEENRASFLASLKPGFKPGATLEVTEAVLKLMAELESQEGSQK